VKINTVQTLLFRQLRELNERRNIQPPAQPHPGKSGMNPPPRNPDKRRAITQMRCLFRAMSRWLTSYYNLCGRTGLDLPREPVECHFKSGFFRSRLKTLDAPFHQKSGTNKAARNKLGDPAMSGHTVFLL